MNSVDLDPKALRPLLHEEIDRLPDDVLAAVHRVLVKFEAHRLADELGAALAEDWAAGRITEEKIAESIREHRSRHPYR